MNWKEWVAIGLIIAGSILVLVRFSARIWYSEKLRYIKNMMPDQKEK